MSEMQADMRYSEDHLWAHPDVRNGMARGRNDPARAGLARRRCKRGGSRARPAGDTRDQTFGEIESNARGEHDA
jgi:hypothetical protein